MRARWINDDPHPEPPRVGTTVIAKWRPWVCWRPWVYYLVSTIQAHTFITQVVRCNEIGVPRSDDSWERPLFEREYRTKQEARLGHQQAVALFAGGVNASTEGRTLLGPTEGPTLLGYLAHQICAPIIRKRLFRGKYVFFGDYMPFSQFLYETAAILGYTYRDRIASFVTLFCEAGQESSMIRYVSEQVSTELASLGYKPKNFMELYFIPETTRLMGVMRDAGLTTYDDWIDFPKLSKHKMRASDIWLQLQFAAVEAVGFGYSQPELAEKLFTYEDDPQEWQEVRSYGLDIPTSTLKPKSIHQRQVEALALIKPYVSKTRPDLMRTLGL